MPGGVVAGETVDVRVVASGVPVYAVRWEAPTTH
jgi:hypothetical protein